MSRKIFDITFPISNELPKWPDSWDYDYGFRLKTPMAVANSSYFSMDSHYGTHIDAPYHFVHDGAKVDELPLDNLIGDAFVASITNRNTITKNELSHLEIPDDCKILLLKTDNEKLWKRNENAFYENFVGLDQSAANWLVEKKINLIGIDYLSIQKFHDGPEVHQILLENDIMILESLKMDMVQEGTYDFICLPLKLKGMEAAPVRVILMEK